MDKDAFIRRALWLSVPFNVAGAILFAFPSSCLSQYFGLPTPVPALYSTVLAFNILLAGGMYACIARQPKIDRHGRFLATRTRAKSSCHGSQR